MSGQKDCPHCGGSGQKYIPERNGVLQCECVKQGRPARLLAAAGIPRTYEHCEFDNYLPPPDNPFLKMALVKAEGYVENYLTQTTGKGLLFMGHYGLGKSHLAVSTIKALMRNQSISCFFCNFSWELQKIRDSMSESQTLILPRLVYDAEVLVLDDFGSQRWSGWVQDMMSAVISNRYDHHQPTLITTNLSDKASVDRVKARSAYLKKLGVMNAEGDIDNFQLQRLENCGIYLRPPRDEPVTLEDQIGERLRSRLYEMCELIPMYGADYRRSLQKQSHER